MLTSEHLLKMLDKFPFSYNKAEKSEEQELIESHIAALDEIERLNTVLANWKHEVFATKELLTAANAEIERLKAELAAAKAENNVRDDALTCIADLIKYVHKREPQGNTIGSNLILNERYERIYNENKLLKLKCKILRKASKYTAEDIKKLHDAILVASDSLMKILNNVNGLSIAFFSEEDEEGSDKA